MSWPSIAVITPVKDGGDWLPGLIQNLSTQTLLPSELIIVDDHSSRAIQEEFYFEVSFDIKVLKNSGFGVSNARNTGMRFSNSEYIAFLDCDDRWDPYKLEKQITEMKSSGLPLSCAGYRQVSLDREILQEREPSRKVITLDDVLSGQDTVYGSASGVIIERAFALTVGEFDPSLSYAEDLDYWLRCLSRSHMCAPSGVFVTIFRHPNSTQDKDFKSSKSSYLQLRSLTHVLQKYPSFSQLNLTRIIQECASRFLQRRIRTLDILRILGNALLWSDTPVRHFVFVLRLCFRKHNAKLLLNMLRNLTKRKE